MSNDNSFRRGGDKFASEVKQLSDQARVKGIGNFDFGTLYDIDVNVAPSSMCYTYCVELYDAFLSTMAFKSGAVDFEMRFTDWDLYVYLTLLLRERITDINKGRPIVSIKDEDIKVPHFYHLMLAHLGEVVDEKRHIWLRVKFDDDELLTINNLYNAKGQYIGTDDREFRMYHGAKTERDFIYAMSRELKQLQMFGFVNGSGLPRGRSGVLEFMLFMWLEGKLKHPEPDIEPGLVVLASLLQFHRSVEILNPYIPYGSENNHANLLREVTLPRNSA
jgi:hypothetical protein